MYLYTTRVQREIIKSNLDLKIAVKFDYCLSLTLFNLPSEILEKNNIWAFFRSPVKQHSIIWAYFLCSFVDKRQFFSPFVCCFFFVFSCIFFHGSQRPKNLRQAKGVREAIPVSNCAAIDDKAFGLWECLEKARQIKTVRVHQQWW